MILRWTETLGDKVIQKILSLYTGLEFSILCFFHALNPWSYNKEMRESFVRQIYSMSITVIPIFSFIAFLFGSIVLGIVIATASKYNLQMQLGSIIVNFVINDFSPIFTAFFISLRSSTLINKQISSHSLQDEDNLINTLVLPRLLSGVFSTVTLSVLFSIIMIVSAYVSIYLFTGMDFHSYTQLLLEALEMKNIFILFVKAIAFGFFIMLIPIYNGLLIAKSANAKKISFIRIFIKLFFAIFFIEIFSLLFLALLHF